MPLIMPQQQQQQQQQQMPIVPGGVPAARRKQLKISSPLPKQQQQQQQMKSKTKTTTAINTNSVVENILALLEMSETAAETNETADDADVSTPSTPKETNEGEEDKNTTLELIELLTPPQQQQQPQPQMRMPFDFQYGGRQPYRPAFMAQLANAPSLPMPGPSLKAPPTPTVAAATAVNPPVANIEYGGRTAFAAYEATRHAGLLMFEQPQPQATPIPSPQIASPSKQTRIRAEGEPESPPSTPPSETNAFEEGRQASMKSSLQKSKSALNAKSPVFQTPTTPAGVHNFLSQNRHFFSKKSTASAVQNLISQNLDIFSGADAMTKPSRTSPNSVPVAPPLEEVTIKTLKIEEATKPIAKAAATLPEPFYGGRMGLTAWRRIQAQRAKKTEEELLKSASAPISMTLTKQA